MKEVKAITIWQPWASLLACGAKRYETRSWATNYRGPIAIHAAAKRPPKQGEISWENFNAITTALAKHYGACRFDWSLGGTKVNSDGTDNGFDIPLGVIIATAELVACHEIVRDGFGKIHAGKQENSLLGVVVACGKIVSGDELLFGDWTPGRYAWEFANIKMLPEPIPAKGMQRLWNWEVPKGVI